MLNDRLNVWTVLWTNGKPFKYSTRPEGSPPRETPETRFYKAEDVIKFQRMVRRHLPDCSFRCLSNVDIPGVEIVPLQSDMVGWWPKMELFRPDLPSGRNLYFDLDTIIIRGLQEIISCPAPFAAIKPGRGVGSNQPAPWKDQEGFWRHPRYQTSVMVWNTQYVGKFWDGFTPEIKAHAASDQDYLGWKWPNEARMPTEWFKKLGASGTMHMVPMDPVKVVLNMHTHNDEVALKVKWVAKRWI